MCRPAARPVVDPSSLAAAEPRAELILDGEALFGRRLVPSNEERTLWPHLAAAAQLAGQVPGAGLRRHPSTQMLGQPTAT